MRLSKKLESDLREVVGDRIVTDPNELSMYAHDTGAMPGMVRLLVTMDPAAVVMPRNKEEVIKLMDIAKNHAVPLTPRGAGSAGYGGAVPAKSGIVVDFSRMNAITNIDVRNNQVTVEPGVVWKNLQTALNHEGKALRIYPTSAPSATVAGWVAQGGAGIGSYQYGPIRNHVVSAEVVLPTGEVKHYAGKDLDFVNDCEGITGFITSLTLGVTEYEDIVPRVAAFGDVSSMCEALNDADIKKLPIWSISFHTPDFVRLQQEANEEDLLPDGVSTIVYALRKSDYDAHKATLEARVAAHGGQFASDHVAAEEWEARFHPMRLKRLGPSVVPGEIIAPVKNIESVLGVIDKSIKARYFAIEGTMADADNFTILAFALDDETRPAFMFGYGASLTLLKATKPLGARAYTTGMYFGTEGPALFGGDRYATLMDFKKQIDPQDLINPGKVLSPRIKIFPLMRLSTAMNLAEPFMRIIGGLTLYERPDKEKWVAKKVAQGSRRFRAQDMEEFMWEIYACAQCSFCKTVCPFFGEKGIEAASPKGRVFFLKELVEGRATFDQNMANAFYYCSMCGYCNEVCQSKIPLMQLLEQGKALAVNSSMGPLPQHAKLAESARQSHNPYGQPQDACKNLIPGDISYKDSGKVMLFPGCTSSFKTKGLAENTVKIMDAAGVDFGYCEGDTWCCGSPFLRTGQQDVAEELILHNIERLNAAGAETIVSPCPGCTMTIAHYWPKIAKKHGIPFTAKAKHVTVFTDELIKDGKLEFAKNGTGDIKVTYHDPCHIGRHMKVYDQPRDVLKALPGVELVEMSRIRDEAQCCGAGGGVRSGLKDLADSLAGKRMEEARATGASMITSSCPFCDMSFQIVNTDNKYGMDVRDVTDLVVERLAVSKKK